MTHDEAVDITEMILRNWAKPEWTTGQIETYVSALMPYDPTTATEAVARAHKELNFRPPLAEFLSFYRLAKTEAASRQQTPLPEKRDKNKMPVWVRRYVCARFLYERFGKAQDFRRFPEMGDWADPDVPLMPPDEWVKEAAAIGDREAMRAIGIQ